MAGTDNQNTLSPAMNRVMFDQALPAILLAVGISSICVILLFGRVSTLNLGLWVGAMSVVLVLRLLIGLHSRRCVDSDLPVVMYTIVMGLNGAVWGSLTALWSPDLAIDDQLVILLIPLATTLGLLMSLSSNQLTYRTSLFCFVLCTAGFMFQNGDEAFLRLVSTLMLFLVACLYLSHSFHVQLRETLQLRGRNQKLVDNLSDQNLSLLAARDEAEAACRSKDEFLDRMSHELRTPMNGVLGMSRLLTKSSLADDQKKLVETLNASGETMMALVTDLLDASSLATGKLKLDENPFNLRQTLAALESAYAADVDNDAVLLSVQVDDDVPGYLMGDEPRVTQLICKLFSNAVKFTRYGKIEISVALEDAPLDESSSEAGTVRWVLQVRDTGAGIAHEELDSVRNLFHQVEGTASRRFGGSGLGLTIAQGLVDLMDGTLDIESVLGKGTTVIVKIPMQVPSSLASTVEETAIDSVVAATNEGSNTGLIRALVAEDNPVNQVVIETILEDLGCEITLAENGSEALLALEQRRFDIVFMDCQMPEVDGYEATRQARQRGLSIPIVAVTANTLSGDREKCLDAGMDDYVAKPFTDTALEIALAKWVGPRFLKSA